MTTKARKTAVQISRDEARDFYLEIFGSFAVEIYDTGDKRRGERTIDNRDKEPVVDAINAQFAATDATDQTIVRDWVNGEYEVWQAWHTYDDWSEEQAAGAFDLAWPTDLIEVEVGPAKTSTTVPATECRCGCGQPTNKGKGYLPGHDARHAGAVARAILANPTKEAWAALKALPTEALRTKARAQVERGNNRSMGSGVPIPAAPATDGVVNGYVMVPRPHFRIGERVPAQTFLVSGEQRMNINDAKDGSGDWLDAEGYQGKTQKYWLKRFRPTVQRVAVEKKGTLKRAGRRPGGDGPDALKDLLTF